MARSLKDPDHVFLILRNPGIFGPLSKTGESLMISLFAYSGGNFFNAVSNPGIAQCISGINFTSIPIRSATKAMQGLVQ